MRWFPVHITTNLESHTAIATEYFSHLCNFKTLNPNLCYFMHCVDTDDGLVASL